MAVWSVVAAAARGGMAGHHMHLVLGAAAMVYMAVAMATAPAGSMAGMAGMRGAPPGVPVVTACLLAYFAGYALWAGATHAARGHRDTHGRGRRPGAGAAGGVLAAPELAAACRVSLGIGMFAMLLTM